MRIIYLLLTFISITLVGCNPNGPTTDAEEEKNPLVQEGEGYMDTQDYAAAEASLKKAINDYPGMAKPCLDLASIYHQYKPDYIKAIFYYERYLELRPETEKADFIQEQIQDVQKLLAQAILEQSGAMKAFDDLKQYKKENKRLNQQIYLLQKKVVQLSEERKALQQKQVATAPKAKNKTVAQQPKKTATVNSSGKHQIYTVVSGDNLTKIAKKFYGNTNYDIIYNANRDRMKNPGDLRVGQTLVIPQPVK